MKKKMILTTISKEKGFSKGLRKSHEKSNKKPKNQANMWSTGNSRFCGKYIEKQPKTSQNSLFSVAFWEMLIIWIQPPMRCKKRCVL